MKQITIILNGERRNKGLDKKEFNELTSLGFKYEVKEPQKYETNFLEAREIGNADYEYIWHKKRMLVGSFEEDSFSSILDIIENLTSRNRVDVCVTNI